MGAGGVTAEYSYSDLTEDISAASSLVFFTGAGVSTASGIRSFRGAHGLYTEEPEIEKKLSRHYLYADPEGFWDNWHRNMVFPADASPNSLHRVIGKLSEDASREVSVVTQNVDGLHEQVMDAQKVICLHGSSGRECTGCGMETEDAPYHVSCTSKKKRKIVRPRAVLFGETLDASVFSEAAVRLSSADLVVVVGTSLQVYPAASLLSQVSEGARVVFLNDEPPEHLPEMSAEFCMLLGDFSEFFDEVLEKF